MTEQTKWTSEDICTAVRKHFGAEKDGFGPEWSALSEYTLQPGGWGRRADMFLVRAWGGKPKGHERITIEVKVSRSDFLREKAQPQKMAPFQEVSHRVYFATPEGVIKDTDDLGDIGHLLVTNRGVRIARKGVRNNTPADLSETAFVEAFRRASRAEARHRSAADDPVTQVLALQQEVARLKRARDAAMTREQKNDLALSAWVHIVSTVGGVPCECGAMLKKVSKTALRSGHLGWRCHHADGSDCPNGYPRADLHALVRQILGHEEDEEVGA